MAAIQTHNQMVDLGAQAAGLARTQTRGTQSLIRLNDRDIAKIEAKAAQEASLLGSLGYYGWGAGKDRVEGPSWELAKALIRVYGNCSLDMEPIQDLPDSWVMTARVVDHETGYSISRQFRQSKKWTVYGKFDEARKDDIRFQIGQSKSLRNVVLSFLPGWLVERAMDQAKGGVREKIEAAINKHGMEAVVARCFERCEKIGVDEARVLDVMGRKTRQAITVEDLVILQGGISAVESGQDSADSVFPVITVEATEPATGSKSEQVVAKIRNNGSAAEKAGRETPAAPSAEPPDIVQGDAASLSRTVSTRRKSEKVPDQISFDDSDGKPEGGGK